MISKISELRSPKSSHSPQTSGRKSAKMNDHIRKFHNLNDSILSASEISIGQVKSKITEYLRCNLQTSPLNYQNEPTLDITKNTNDNFRVSLFKSNLKKKINLKMLQNIQTQRYNQIRSQFNVSEALINPRSTPKTPKIEIEEEFITKR